MRPDQTLPPASSLAVLAAFPLALLFGCVEGELEPGCEGEGELEPGCEAALVDALVEEVETGLWAGEGNPLAYGDEDDGYRCDEMDDDCFKKCFDGPSDTCTCEEDLENEDWCCCFGEPGCDMCTGGGGGCGGGEGEGTGGGEGEEDEEDEEDEDEGEGIWGGGALRLNCFESRRGERGGCEVRTALDMDSLRFEWLFGGYEGEGEFYSSWRGTATETRKIGVAVTMLGRDNRMRMLTGKAVVRSRPWALGTLDAKLEYSSLPGDPNHWGLYKRPTLADNMFENVGTGPWEGTFYIFSPPRWIGEPKMYVHTDFKPSGNRYPIDPKKHQDSIAIRTCKVSGSLNVHDLNSACGDSVALGNFHDLMVAHEKMHQRSLNECITTVNRWRGRLAEIEGIVRDESGKAEEEANALWASIYADLEEAYFTDQKGQKSDSIWSWRPSGPWLDDPVRLVDHNGRRGCP